MSTTELLKARLKEVQAEKAAELAKTLPWRAAIDKAEEKIAKIKAETADERGKLRAANIRLSALDGEISRLALAVGGRRMSDA
jgi:uncharacterized protein involved in outer membrane biogenesis